MIDRQKVETILRRRFPGASWSEIATAANAIVGLEDEWQEVGCQDGSLAAPIGELEQRAEIRLFCRVLREDT